MLIDISRTLGLDSIVFPGDPDFRATPYLDIAAGDPCNVTRLETSNHCGTHMDAPRHFLADGKTLDAYTPERFVLDAVVIETGDARAIEVAQLTPPYLDDSSFEPGMALLFKTRNGAYPRDRFYEDFCYIAPDAARRAVELGASLIGLDYLTVDPPDADDFPAHHILLGADVLILEDIDLRAIPPGRYRLHCPPIKLHESNGAPCRAFLETLDGR